MTLYIKFALFLPTTILFLIQKTTLLIDWCWWNLFVAFQTHRSHFPEDLWLLVALLCTRPRTVSQWHFAEVGYHSANLSGGWGQARPGHQNKTYPAFFCRSFPWWHLGWTAVSSPCTVHQTLVGCSCPLSESTRQQQEYISNQYWVTAVQHTNTTWLWRSTTWMNKTAPTKSGLGHWSTMYKHHLLVIVQHLNEQNSTHQIRTGSLQYNPQTPQLQLW